MTTIELQNAAQFIVDQEGQQKGVLLDIAVWQHIIAALKKLEALEAQANAKNQAISAQNQQALALLQAWG